jgi:hypothetical protein
MIEFNENEWEKIAARKEMERQQEIKEIEELQRLNKLPFFKRIQEPGQEVYLMGFEEKQKEVFLNHSVKKWGINKEEGLELFQEFFTEFLKGEVESIYDFMIKRGYKVKNE